MFMNIHVLTCIVYPCPSVSTIIHTVEVCCISLYQQLRKKTVSSSRRARHSIREPTQNAKERYIQTMKRSIHCLQCTPAQLNVIHYFPLCPHSTSLVCVPLSNPLDHSVLFKCECSNTKHFIIPALTDSQVTAQHENWHLVYSIYVQCM